MGNAKSTCKVSNEARYEIQVDVFGADDVGLEFAKLQIRLQPGQLGSISTSKKGVQLRIAGNGRVQQPILVCPGETINVHKVHRGTAAPHADDMQADSPVREEPAVESPSREARSRSAADQQVGLPCPSFHVYCIRRCRSFRHVQRTHASSVPVAAARTLAG